MIVHHVLCHFQRLSEVASIKTIKNIPIFCLKLEQSSLNDRLPTLCSNFSFDLWARPSGMHLRFSHYTCFGIFQLN